MGPPKRERRRAGNAAPDLKQVISDSTNFILARFAARLQARMSREIAGFGQPSLRGGGDDPAG
jgi:hypothetical protein